MVTVAGRDLVPVFFPALPLALPAPGPLALGRTCSLSSGALHLLFHVPGAPFHPPPRLEPTCSFGLARPSFPRTASLPANPSLSAKPTNRQLHLCLQLPPQPAPRSTWHQPQIPVASGPAHRPGPRPWSPPTIQAPPLEAPVPAPRPTHELSPAHRAGTHGSSPGANSAWGGSRRTWVPLRPRGTRRSRSRCTGRALSRSGCSYTLDGHVDGVRSGRPVGVLRTDPHPAWPRIPPAGSPDSPGDAPHIKST